MKCAGAGEYCSVRPRWVAANAAATQRTTAMATNASTGTHHRFASGRASGAATRSRSRTTMLLTCPPKIGPPPKPASTPYWWAPVTSNHPTSDDPARFLVRTARR